ncbi:maleylacetate reductase [Niveispirillum fermenti]|uniref:maleylacetate reductase n=1 Tax=Niveispirillum fermenti TaxID=1233113 RepID=UPI003A863D3F
MTPFVYTANPVRVQFGSDLLKTAVAEEVTRIGAKRPMILTTPEQESDGRKLAEYLTAFECSIFHGARMHTPVDTTLRAMEDVARRQTDCLIALGGGSTIGLAKAIALRTDLHQIAIPTTYAGSEATPILGETENGVKTTQSSPRIQPEVIIYDVDLTLSLPPALSATSGINAIAHAVEGLYSKQANPIISLIAEEGIRALASGLPQLINDPANKEARSNALYGAWLCGTTLGAVGMAIHHKLCHALGGAFDLPHSQTHTIILPHALAYNAPYVSDALMRIGRAMGTDNAPLALYELARSLGAPTALKDLGMPRHGIDRIVELTFRNQYWNPAPLEETRLRGLLLRAWEGQPPVID